jgi:hypothetical protein
MREVLRGLPDDPERPGGGEKAMQSEVGEESAVMRRSDDEGSDQPDQTGQDKRVGVGGGGERTVFRWALGFVARAKGWVGRKNGVVGPTRMKSETRERAGAGTQKIRLWGIGWCRGNSRRVIMHFHNYTSRALKLSMDRAKILHTHLMDEDTI